MSFEGTAWLPLKDVVEEIIDRRGVTPLKLGGDFVTEGHRVISAKLLKDRTVQLDADEARFVNDEIYKKWMRLPLRAGDVIMTSEAPLGELAYLLEDKDWVLGQRLFAIRPRKDLMNGRFLYYVLQTNAVRSDIQGRATGTTVQGIRQAELRLVKVPVPSLSAQNEAASFLGALDDRITLLRETNKTLEAIAQAIFKSWFIDFDPVRAKMEGRAPAGMDEETAALFPDELVESELGLVPKGWQARTLDNVSTVGIGKTPPRKESEWFSESKLDIPWVSIRDMGEAGVYIQNTSEYLTPKAVDKFNVKRIPAGTVLLSFKLTIGRVSITPMEMTTNEAIAHFKTEVSSPLTSEYIYCHLKSFNYESLGSTSSIADAVNSKTVRLIPILVPNDTLLVKFNELVGAFFKKIKINQELVSTLSSMRDLLLPRLISGKLRITDAVPAEQI